MTSSIEVNEEGAGQRPLTYVEAVHCYACGAAEVASDQCNCQTFRLPRNTLQAILKAVEPLPQGDEVDRALDLIDELYRKYGVELDAEDVKTAQEARAALVRSKLPIEDVLADPHAVHINMLRGGIAKPSHRQVWHIYGKALADEMPDEYRSKLPIGDDVRERVAIALYERCNPVGTWLDCSAETKAEYLADADAAITAIGSQSIEGEMG